MSVVGHGDLPIFSEDHLHRAGVRGLLRQSVS